MFGNICYSLFARNVYNECIMRNKQPLKALKLIPPNLLFEIYTKNYKVFFCLYQSAFNHYPLNIKVKSNFTHVLKQQIGTWVTSGFPCGVNEICAILLFYAAWTGSLLPTFRYNLSIPSSRTGPWRCAQ